MTKEEEQILRKRLLFRSSYRGIKEMDMVLGGFARTNLDEMSYSDMLEFEKVLELPDQQLFSWYMKKEEVPVQQTSKLLKQILKFKLHA